MLKLNHWYNAKILLNDDKRIRNGGWCIEGLSEYIEWSLGHLNSSEWFHTWLWSLVHCAIGHEFKPQWQQTLFRTQAQHLCFIHDFYLIYLIWYYYFSVKFFMWIVKQKIENKRIFLYRVVSGKSSCKSTYRWSQFGFDPQCKQLERYLFFTYFWLHTNAFILTLNIFRPIWFKNDKKRQKGPFKNIFAVIQNETKISVRLAFWNKIYTSKRIFRKGMCHLLSRCHILRYRCRRITTIN